MNLGTWSKEIRIQWKRGPNKLSVQGYFSQEMLSKVVELWELLYIPPIKKRCTLLLYCLTLPYLYIDTNCFVQHYKYVYLSRIRILYHWHGQMTAMKFSIYAYFLKWSSLESFILVLNIFFKEAKSFN